MSGPRQTIQYTQQRLALAPARRGEPLAADRPGTEPPTAKRTTDRPATEDQLMEEVCDRSNLEKAWKRVRRNKGGPGVDGLTIDDTATYLREGTGQPSGHNCSRGPTRRNRSNGSMSRNRMAASDGSAYHVSSTA